LKNYLETLEIIVDVSATGVASSHIYDKPFAAAATSSDERKSTTSFRRRQQLLPKSQQ